MTSPPPPRLTREQRSAIFAGEPPRIAGDGECPWTVGDVYRASARVTLTVLEIRPVKPRWRHGRWTEEGWSLRYEIRDGRDPARLLRPSPHPVDFDQMRKDRDEHGYPYGAPDDPAVLRTAAIESAYTSSRGAALEEAGEAVGDDWLARFAEEAGDRSARERRQRREMQQRLSTERRIVEYQDEAGRRRIDIRSEMRLIGRLQQQGKCLDRVMGGIRRKLDGDAA